MRINKYLAACGIASRRNCEQLVLDGKVRLNGRPVVKLATEVKNNDIVTVDGKKIFPSAKNIYLMLHKPKGYICSTSDEKGRKTVMELVKGFEDTRLFPVGRLDYDTEGLLLLTNDGNFSQNLIHPKNDVEKVYHAKIEGEVTEDELIKIRNGIVLDGEKTKRCKAVNLGIENNMTKIEIIITEGKQRQIRRMFEAINREVVFLKRVAIGPLRLGGLQRGKYRELRIKELEKLDEIQTRQTGDKARALDKRKAFIHNNTLKSADKTYKTAKRPSDLKKTKQNNIATKQSDKRRG